MQDSYEPNVFTQMTQSISPDGKEQSRPYQQQPSQQSIDTGTQKTSSESVHKRYNSQRPDLNPRATIDAEELKETDKNHTPPVHYRQNSEHAQTEV